MWEEDPRWQQAHYKVFVYAICLLTVLIPLVSLFSGDWAITRSYFMGLGVVVAALCLYSVLVWTAIQVVLWAVWLCKRLFRRAHRN